MEEIRFTVREESVLRYIAEGLSNEEISVQLGIEGRTVEFHISRIRQKLGLDGARNVRRLTLCAYELFPPDRSIADQILGNQEVCA